jgi:3-oxoacyl-[acyl-carrier-protein] synthase-3
MIYSKIHSTGSYLPPKIVTNQDLEKIVDTSDEWIVARTGIKQRHFALDHQNTSDLAFEAASDAIKKGNVDPATIDLIIVATSTPDLPFPNVGCLIQERLGIPACPALSLEAACSGFVYALNIADNFIKAGQATRALIIGAELMGRLLDWTDRSTCVLFGDGAGAVILDKSDEPGILYSYLSADGRHRALLEARPKEEGADVHLSPSIHMAGNEVFKVAVKTLESLVDKVIEDNNLEKGDIDWLVPHQANLRIITATAKRLNMPMEQVVLTIQYTGNTSAATVPIALDVAVSDGRIKRGQLVLLEAFGAGFTWGANFLKF